MGTLTSPKPQGIVTDMRFKSASFIIVICLLATGCNVLDNLPSLLASATPSPTATATQIPTTTPTPWPSPTPTPEPAARIHGGDQALKNGDWETALQEFQKALQSSNDPEIQSAGLLGTGRTHLLAGQNQEAATVLEDLLVRFPGSEHAATANFLLAQAYTNLEYYPQATAAFSKYLDLRSGIIDGYIYELRGDASMQAGDYSNAIRDFSIALKSPGLMDSTYLEMRIARSYALAGDTTTALTLYDDLFSRTNSDATKSLILYRKGEIYTQLGQLDQAHQVYSDLVTQFPNSAYSYSALLTLVEANIPVNELNRGLVDYYAGEYGMALTAFNRYLQNQPEDPATARYFTGLANRALGGYDGAIQEWQTIIRDFPDHPYWDEAWDQVAYTQWYYQEQYKQAVVTLLAFVEQSSAHPRAAEYLYDAARVSERDNQLKQAAELWMRVVNEYPSSEYALPASFQAGIAAYRAEDYATALSSFQRYYALVNTPGDLARANFWIAKTQLQLGDPTAARMAWQQAAEADPTGYYSERARDILRRRAPFYPPQDYDLMFDIAQERLQAEEWMRTKFGLPAETRLSGLGDLPSDAAFVRGNELWELGLFEEGRNEFEELRARLENDPVKLFQLADHLAQIGLYRSATLASRQVLNLAGMDDAETMNAPRFFNYLRFGVYYKDLVLPLATEAGFHPLQIFSVIRQESLFESYIQSSAYAQGLMQIIPSTGAEIARNMGWPEDYSESDLSRPLVNLTFGVNYLKTQLNAFDGNLYAALAAYNGGPGNARHWLNLAPEDPDLFVEVIRYPETQDYIRRIYEIFNIYRGLYNRSE